LYSLYAWFESSNTAKCFACTCDLVSVAELNLVEVTDYRVINDAHVLIGVL